MMRFKNFFRGQERQRSLCAAGNRGVVRRVGTKTRRSLSDLQALVLIGAIFMMPIALLTYNVYDEHNKQIRFAQKELRGPTCGSAARHATIVDTHRGLVVVLGGETSDMRRSTRAYVPR